MKVSVSGLKLNFDSDEEIGVEKGKKQLLHRVELIENALDEKDYDKAAEMFFNYKIRNCRHATNLDLSKKESALFDRFIKETQETIE